MSAPTTDTAPCAGCINRRSDGNHEWACLGCKRWWPDLYERQEEPETTDPGRALPLLEVAR